MGNVEGQQQANLNNQPHKILNPANLNIDN